MRVLPVVLSALPLLATTPAPTLGAGVYPGRPSERSAPELRPGPPGRRNLARHRPAFQSSAYDYNLTAQLVTDGLVADRLPTWCAVATSDQGLLPRHQRERLFDGNWVSDLELKGSGALAPEAPAPWVRLDFGGERPAVDAMEVRGMVRFSDKGPESWACVVSGSEDGRSWTRLGAASGKTLAGGEFLARIPLASASRFPSYRLELVDPRARTWTLQEWSLSHQGRGVPVGGPERFTSAWKPAGRRAEWVSVDLGAPSTVDQVVLHWLARPAAGVVQASLDGVAWQTLAALPAEGRRDVLSVRRTKARYVRVRLDRAADALLSELEVWGEGGVTAVPRPQPAATAEGDLELTGGAWRVVRDSQVQGTGEQLTMPGFRDEGWLPATVPGTVLASYVAAGAVAEPLYGDQQHLASDAFFHADFWYRTTFTAPPRRSGERQWLCLDGVNWKAEVFLNGARLGRVEGIASRGRFDVTEHVRPDGVNTLAIRVEKNAHPGAVKEKTLQSPGENGGVLGRDNPTFHASIGWDWIPTIRGRNTGLWDRVRLLTRGEVTLEAPSLTTRLPLPDTSTADVHLALTLRRHGSAPVRGRVVGRLGEVSFEQAVTLTEAQTLLKLDPSTHPALRLQNPRLWWPNGYGEAHLYPVELSFVPEGSDRPSDQCRFQAGLREFTSSPAGEPLRLWVNGRRFIPKGGNWGFSEALLRYREREFDAALRYHRDMHFNMVRNWLGMVGQEAFYDACDRHGIVVWQDFWLANPWDGDDPADHRLFLDNAAELVARVRTHPSIGLYCGRNEGIPPLELEEGVRGLLGRLHPGIPYVPSSADGAVSGYGPYQVQPLEAYGGRLARPKLHSEMGMPNIPTLESLRLMMPAGDLWPIGRLWGLHDFCLSGAQGAASFLESLRRTYGFAGSLQDWERQAQLLNYDGYRAMFEGQNEQRMGLLIWMSHPAWPSMVWQTYDYYLAPTAAYFGAKKACEPLHLQWNEGSDQVRLINTSAGEVKGLTARAQLYTLDGTLAWERSAPSDSPEDSSRTLFRVSRPPELAGPYLLRLRLEREGQVVSTNDYLRGRSEGDTQTLRDLPPAWVTLGTRTVREGDLWILEADLHNASEVPALQVSLCARRSRTGDRILPALYSDNYIHLLPGERRTLRVVVRDEDTRGEAPRLDHQGFNL